MLTKLEAVAEDAWLPIPEAMLAELGLKIGDSVQIHAVGTTLCVRPLAQDDQNADNAPAAAVVDAEIAAEDSK